MKTKQSLYSPFSEDSNVFVRGTEKGGEKSTEIMFLIKTKVESWIKTVTKTPGQKCSMVWAEHRSHQCKLSRFWQGAYGFIYYCSVIRIEPGYSSLLSEWREFGFLAFSLLQKPPNWLHIFKFFFPRRRNIIQAGKPFHMFKVIEKLLQVCNVGLFHSVLKSHRYTLFWRIRKWGVTTRIQWGSFEDY